MLEFSGVLDKVLSPIDKDTFFERYWEREPFVIKRDQPDYFEDIISLNIIDKILSRRDIFYPVVRVFHDGFTVPPKEFTNSWVYGFSEFEGMIDTHKLYQLYLHGATINFRVLERFYEPLMILCRGMELQLGSGADVSVFLTPKDSGHNLQPHYDAVEAFILQAGGRKRWRVWRNTIELPLAQQEYSPYAVDVSEDNLIGEYTLDSGDTLYVPRGLTHDAITIDSYSLHATVGITTVCWFNLISKLTADTLKKLQDNLNYQRALPLPSALFSSNDPAELHNAFSEMLEDFRKHFDLNRGRELVNRGLLVGRYPSRPRQILDLVNLASLTLDDEVFRREAIIFSLTETKEQICLEFHDKTVILPSVVSEAVSFITQVTSFKIRVIPGAIDDPSRLVLVRRLIKEGLLTRSRVSRHAA